MHTRSCRQSWCCKCQESFECHRVIGQDLIQLVAVEGYQPAHHRCHWTPAFLLIRSARDIWTLCRHQIDPLWIAWVGQRKFLVQRRIRRQISRHRWWLMVWRQMTKRDLKKILNLIFNCFRLLGHFPARIKIFTENQKSQLRQLTVLILCFFRIIS